MVLDSSNYPHIAYRGNYLSPVGLRYAAWNGTFWNKQIEKIQIYPAVPEYPIGAIFALTACFLTLVAYVAFKKGAGIAQLNTRRQELKRGN